MNHIFITHLLYTNCLYMFLWSNKVIKKKCDDRNRTGIDRNRTATDRLITDPTSNQLIFPLQPGNNSSLGNKLHSTHNEQTKTT